MRSLAHLSTHRFLAGHHRPTGQTRSRHSLDTLSTALHYLATWVARQDTIAPSQACSWLPLQVTAERCPVTRTHPPAERPFPGPQGVAGRWAAGPSSLPEDPFACSPRYEVCGYHNFAKNVCCLSAWLRGLGYHSLPQRPGRRRSFQGVQGCLPCGSGSQASKFQYSGWYHLRSGRDF